ncbi:MAG TPA: bifunctional oligoribonuclease/PAP phosphatase NrnA [bacterium]|nr:bifunctional oligoribonuclease/PAP phosphatase NrnA [bacterium]MDX9805043.1 bifunctional oligoribonuclease/PAP phosphatase NrnA [bacterium]HNZ54355.1 bifunctional oligoribonuclease/PAP phosphatase NrnA [bacterium]HOB71293.1 bifunctional oligoribonuclease/PAP phosphatase NrnA [bacterium]HPA56111.1 bifunctional oligoribonuclease/PAP phosphatase NrnA [bacterium]
MSDFRKINEIIDSSRSILIAGHEMPDGDSMGSCIAMASILERMGKDVKVYRSGQFPFNYMFLKGSGNACESIPEGPFDLFVILDSGSPERVGEDLYKLMASSTGKKILFDHHTLKKENDDFFDAVYSDTSACATAAIVYRWAADRGMALNKEESEAVYSAIISDTGGLKYGSTNKESFIILSELLDRVNPWDVATRIYENVPVEQLKMLSEVLADLRILAEGKAAVIRITLDQFERYKLHPDHVDSFVNYARSIKGVQIAMRFREKGPGTWKVSMRSRGNIDANEVASRFGGGGHKNAAGFVFKGTFEEGLKAVEEIVRSVSN